MHFLIESEKKNNIRFWNTDFEMKWNNNVITIFWLIDKKWTNN